MLRRLVRVLATFARSAAKTQGVLASPLFCSSSLAGDPRNRNCAARRRVPAGPGSIVAACPILARCIRPDTTADHCHCARRDDVWCPNGGAARRVFAADARSSRRLFEPLAANSRILLEIYPTKPGFPGTLRDVVKTYSLPVTIQGRCGRAVLILCHNIRKINAIFLAKYDVNKEILTFLLVEFKQNLSL
jgi:hypothetical protein